MTGRYATGTRVSPENSRGEIERTLRRYGATDFGYMTNETRAAITFRLMDRIIRFVLLLPRRQDVQKTPKGYTRHKASIIGKVQDQAVRQAWRALALAIKAKLE